MVKFFKGASIIIKSKYKKSRLYILLYPIYLLLIIVFFVTGIGPDNFDDIWEKTLREIENDSKKNR